MSIIYPALGAAIAIAGGDKLSGEGSYRRMFQGLGWWQSKHAPGRHDRGRGRCADGAAGDATPGRGARGGGFGCGAH